MSHDELLAEYERIKTRVEALEREANRLQEEKGSMGLNDEHLDPSCVFGRCYSDSFWEGKKRRIVTGLSH